MEMPGTDGSLVPSLQILPHSQYNPPMPASEHDKRYKRLFTHHYFIQKLLESFVHEDFIANLDFSTLKRLDRKMVTKRFKEKESDLIYSVNYKDRPMFIFLMTEFQSTVDKTMPLRFLRYIAEFYENLDRGSQQKHRLPPVLPILLYTGSTRWTAPPNFQTMVEQSIPSKYIPHFEYFPILVNEIPAETLYNMQNAVSAVFYFENSRVEDIIATIDALFEIVKNEDNEVFKEFRLWLNDCLKPLGDYKILQTVDRVFSQMEEGDHVFAASVEEYKAKLFEEGRQEGISEGVRKGKQEGKQEGRQEGRQEGKLEGSREIARKFKQSGIALEIISKNTGLSLDEIEAL